MSQLYNSIGVLSLKPQLQGVNQMRGSDTKNKVMVQNMHRHNSSLEVYSNNGGNKFSDNPYINQRIMQMDRSASYSSHSKTSKNLFGKPQTSNSPTRQLAETNTAYELQKIDKPLKSTGRHSSVGNFEKSKGIDRMNRSFANFNDLKTERSTANGHFNQELSNSVRELPKLKGERIKMGMKFSQHSGNSKSVMGFESERAKTSMQQERLKNSVSQASKRSNEKSIITVPQHMKSVDERSEIVEYGVKGYCIVRDAFLDKPHKSVINWNSYKKPEDPGKRRGKLTMWDDIARTCNRGKVPPTLYAKQINWNEMSISKMHGHPHKDEFRKKERVTSTQESFNTAKKRNIPAPCAYDLPPFKIPSFANSKTDQLQAFNNSQYQAKQVPDFKYDVNPGHRITQPKIFQLKILPDKNKDKHPYKITKSKDPCVGSYEDPQSFRKTQLHSSEREKFLINKGPKVGHIEHAVKLKKGVPAPGTYKNVESAYKRLSTSPPSLRTKRH